MNNPTAPPDSGTPLTRASITECQTARYAAYAGRPSALTLLTAMPGSGKSSLLRSWIHLWEAGSEFAPVYLQLTPIRSTRKQIWADIRHALRQSGLVAHDHAGEDGPLPPVTGCGVLIIDAASWCVDPQFAVDIVRSARAEPRLRWVVAGFDDGPLRAAAAAEPAVSLSRFTEAELFLGQRDVVELLRTSGLHRDAICLESVAQDLLARTGGHPQRLWSELVGHSGSAGELGTGPHAFPLILGNGGIIDALPPVVAHGGLSYLDFLLTLSYLNPVPLAFAGTLADREVVGAHLARVVPGFHGELLRDSEGNHVLNWDPAVRRVLQARAELRNGPARAAARRAASRWLSHSGDLALALVLALEAGDLDAAEDLLLQHPAALLGGHDPRITRALARINPSRLHTPALLFLAGLDRFLLAGPSFNARRLLLRAHAVADGQRVGMRRDARSAVPLLLGATAAGLLGRLADAAASADRAERILDEVARSTEPRAPEDIAWQYLVIGHLHLQCENYQRAQRALRDALDVGGMRLELRDEALETLAVLDELDGRARTHAHGRGSSTAPEPLPPQSWTALRRTTITALREVWVRLNRGEPGAALSEDNRWRPLLPDPGSWPLLVATRILLLTVAEQFSYAEETSDDYLRRASGPDDGFEVSAMVTLTMLFSSVAAGRLDRARAHRSALLIDDELAGLADIVIALTERDDQRAYSASIESGIEAIEVPRFESYRLLFHAIAAARLGNDADAAEQLARILSHAVPGVIPVIYAYVSDADRAELARAALSSGRPELVRLISEVRRVPSVVRDLPLTVTLTEREHAVLECAREGKSNPEIAQTLFVSVNTVKTQLSSVYRKLAASSRQEAVDIALRAGLIGRGGEPGRR